MSIYGGCVSRDSVESSDDLTVVSYVARQSIISAMTPPVEIGPGDFGLHSAFRRRMVMGDINSDALRRIIDVAPRSDVLLLDILIERLGILPVDGGSFVTPSLEYQQSSLNNTIASGHPISFGTDEHFGLWRTAADRLLSELLRAGMIERTAFVWIVFAERDENGTPMKAYRGKSIDTWNALFGRYHQYLADSGIRHLRLSPDPLADSMHKWGPEPFHYSQDAYSRIADFVREIASHNARSLKVMAGTSGAQK